MLKQQLIQGLSKSPEDSVLLAGILDKIKKCEEKQILTHTGFLDLRQGSMVLSLLQKTQTTTCVFWGGYEDAERKSAVFLPDYAQSIPENLNPLVVIKAVHKNKTALSHRDYLGALMSLGIKRQFIGDVLIDNNTANLFLLKEIGPFIVQNLKKAGNLNLECEMINFINVINKTNSFLFVPDTVSSLRADAIAGSCFSLPRTKAVEAINSKKFFCNGVLVTKPDKLLSIGDTLTLRGSGKAQIDSIEGKTKKGRFKILYKKYGFT